MSLTRLRRRRSPATFGLLAATVAVVSLSACQPHPVPPVGLSPPSAPAGEHRIARSNDDGTPVRWNPCRPVRYVLNLTHAPAFAASELTAAVAELERASGLDLVYAGPTSERPQPDRPRRDPSRYGDGWAPILISFAPATELPFGSPTASGWGQAVATAGPRTGALQYVTGQVVLRPGGWTAGVSSVNPLRLMLQHELGHVVGLGHVPSKVEIMGTGGNGTARRWGTGDRAGLAAVGRPAGCLPTLP